MHFFHFRKTNIFVSNFNDKINSAVNSDEFKRMTVT